MFVRINKGSIDNVHTSILIECSHVYFERQDNKSTIVTAIYFDSSSKEFTVEQTTAEDVIEILNNQGTVIESY